MLFNKEIEIFKSTEWKCYVKKLTLSIKIYFGGLSREL